MVAILTSATVVSVLPVALPSPGATPKDVVRQVRADQWHLPYLEVPEVHHLSQGEGVIVAVPDTGVHPHPDLARNLLTGKNLLPGSRGDGRKDPNGHGTAMAGIIGAHAQGRGRGVLGIAPRAQVLPIISSTHDNVGDTERLALAIEYAIGEGADVISISGGGGTNPRLIRALQSAQLSDVVVVAAAGNISTDSTVIYPAALDTVIAVSGIDRSGEFWVGSAYGPQVDVSAPAVDIYSTGPDMGYRRSTGTSGATAIVAGAVALIRAKYPYLPADEVAHRLTATAIDKGPPGRDDQYGYGVIDLVAALTADVPPRGFGSVPADAPDTAGPSTAAAGPPADDGRAATVRGLVTLGVLVAAGGVWALVARHRRRSDDPPPRVTR
ncbi:type VII secretion-associated serine protease mycosin [Micromonospora palythoicola]|uniref:type VII secretion-associated serine protease mycosin n=1 Tax=Micromonospora palythoicola TaxID=3120507 RepID=UPI0038CC1296